MKLTPQQIKDRAALIEVFRKAITAAIWEEIEVLDQSLLCDDCGTPYGSIYTETMRVSSLEQMVEDATRAACKTLENWL